MERWQGKVALVTGASSGIGAAICQELVKHGLKVVGCARSVDKIKELAAGLKDCPGSLTAIHCDLSKTENIEPMFKTIKDKFGGVDICINNAGMLLNASLLEASLANMHTMMNVNFMSAALCSQLTIKNLIERPDSQGQVININSVMGHSVHEHGIAHFYSCTKYAMKALTEGLMHEAATLQSNVIRVSQISPGLVATNIARAAFPDNPHIAKMMEENGISASRIADTVTFILTAPQTVQVREVIIEPTPKKSKPAA